MSDRFTIADVVELRGLNTLRGRNAKTVGKETYIDCPFCGNNKGKFSYNIRKNTYHCWSCEASGNSVKFWIETNCSSSDYSGIDGSKEAIKDIFAALNGDTIMQSFHKKEIEALKNVTEEIDMAPDIVRNKTNRALLSKLKLKKNHLDNLIARGFTKEQVFQFKFRTTPTPQEALKVCEELIQEGYTLEGVPGFYIDEKGRWNLYIAGQGILCPVIDGEFNYILGFQIRLDQPYGNAKYMWVASADRKKGVSSGALTTHLPGKQSGCILIIEGILKATLVWAFLKGAVTVIGIPGVNAKTSLRAILDRYNMAYVYEAFDMDKAIRPDPDFVGEDINFLRGLVKDFKNGKNPVFNNSPLNEDKVSAMKEYVKTVGISEAAKELRDICSDEYKFDVHPLTWDFTKDGYWKEQYKGLDDFLLEYNDRDKFLNYIQSKAQKSLDLQKYFANC